MKTEKENKSLYENITTRAVVAVCTLGLMSSSCNLGNKYTIYGATVTKVDRYSNVGIEPGFRSVDSLGISLNKYSGCVFFNEDSSIKVGDELEKIVIKSTLMGCDDVVEYKIKEDKPKDKPKSKWEPEIEYLINKD